MTTSTTSAMTQLGVSAVHGSHGQAAPRTSSRSTTRRPLTARVAVEPPAARQPGPAWVARYCQAAGLAGGHSPACAGRFTRPSRAATTWWS